MVARRTVLAWAGSVVLNPFRHVSGQTSAKRRTYVIVHGAWGGGWAWRTVGDVLTARGHVVFRPTLTGLGERAHLASPEIGLVTHISDVVNLLLYEDLRDVILVGHSYGGMVVTGVADRAHERIAHLAYIDALVPEDGESVMTVMTLLSPELAAQIKGQTHGAFNIPTWVTAGAAPPTPVPQPARTFTEPIALKNNERRQRIPTSYILTVAHGLDTDDFDGFAARAKAKGWNTSRMTANHNPQLSAPKELCSLLEQLH